MGKKSPSWTPVPTLWFVTLTGNRQFSYQQKQAKGTRSPTSNEKILNFFSSNDSSPIPFKDVNNYPPKTPSGGRLFQHTQQQNSHNSHPFDQLLSSRRCKEKLPTLPWSPTVWQTGGVFFFSFFLGWEKVVLKETTWRLNLCTSQIFFTDERVCCCHLCGTSTVPSKVKVVFQPSSFQWLKCQF